MKRKLLTITIILNILILTASCGSSSSKPSYYMPGNWGINAGSLPDKVSKADLPEPYTLQSIYGFQSKDISKKDFSGLSLEDIANVSFDSYTKWPAKNNLPKGYDPKEWLETGKDPGLNMDQLHKDGYTGKGISVAVIDKPILSGHKEFAGRMVYTPAGKNETMHFHGLACASILAGKTCGVAPQSKLYYYAVYDDGKNFYNYTQALKQIVERNESLPDDKKIRVVSISDGIDNTNKYWKEWNDELEKATNSGLIVVYSNNAQENFCWGGCQPYKDRNDYKNVSLDRYIVSKVKDIDPLKKWIIVPSDFHTTAGNQGQDAYIYHGTGGFSWAIAYLAGIYTLGLQADPTLTYEEMTEILKSTKSITPEGFSIINPRAFIDSIESQKK